MRRIGLPILAALITTAAITGAIVAVHDPRLSSADIRPNEYSMPVEAPTTGQVGGGSFTVTASLEHGGVSSPDQCPNDGFAAPHGCYQAAQWSIQYDPQVIDIDLASTMRHPSAPAACTSKGESQDMLLLLGCLSLEGATLAHSGIVWNIAASCIAQGTSAMTLLTGGSPETFVNDGLTNQPIHVHNDSIACNDPNATDTATPSSTASPTETRTPTVTPTPTNTRTPRPTPSVPTENVYLIHPAACLALSPGMLQTLCLPGFSGQGAAGGALYQANNRAQFSFLLDTNEDAIVSEDEVARLAAGSGHQLHQSDGAFVVAITVYSDDPLRLRTNAGALEVTAGVRAQEFVCSLPAGADTTESDEDCDGDGEPGDGVIYAHLLGADDERGPGLIEVLDADSSEPVGDASFEIVGEPVLVVPEPTGVVLQAGGHPADCRLPADPADLPGARPLEQAAVTGSVRDDTGTPVTGGWVNWSSSDDAVARVAAISVPSLDYVIGVVSPNIVCGVSPGTAEVTLDLEKGARIGVDILLLDPDTQPDSDTIDVTVVGPAATLALTANTPTCGDEADVTATARNSAGDLVLDGNPVTFTVNGASTTALTDDGIARLTLTPPPAGTTVMASIPVGPATFPLDENGDQADNDGDGSIDEGDEFDLNTRVPNPNVITAQMKVGCTEPSPTPTDTPTPTTTAAPPATATPPTTLTATPTTTATHTATATSTSPATHTATPTSTHTPQLVTATPSFTATPAKCFGDVDGDGRVTLRDIVAVARALFHQNPAADINGDGKVSLRDLALVIKAWHADAC